MSRRRSSNWLMTGRPFSVLSRPGLQDCPIFPKSNQEVAAIGNEVWGRSQEKIGESAYGRGRVFWGMSLEEAPKLAKIDPDVQFAARDPISWIHRKVGYVEVYFISNQKDAALPTLLLRRNPIAAYEVRRSVPYVRIGNSPVKDTACFLRAM